MTTARRSWNFPGWFVPFVFAVRDGTEESSVHEAAEPVHRSPPRGKILPPLRVAAMNCSLEIPANQYVIK
jgi:hypothetical protein